MPDAQSFPFDQIETGCCNVQKQVDQVVFKQIDLIDIEEAAMRLGQQARLKDALARNQRSFEIERSAQTVFGCSQRQINNRRLAADFLGSGPAAADRAAFCRFSRFAIESAAAIDRNFRQQLREPANRRRLARSAVTENKHPTQSRLDSNHQKRLLHLVLADNRGKRKRLFHCATSRWIDVGSVICI